MYTCNSGPLKLFLIGVLQPAKLSASKYFPDDTLSDTIQTGNREKLISFYGRYELSGFQC